MDDAKSQKRSSSASEGEGFDSILGQLQTIVERLESADLGLEESLHAFELGIELSRRGQAILDAAERRVEVLMQDGRTEALDPGKDEQAGR